jgi:hypothetical protein
LLLGAKQETSKGVKLVLEHAQFLFVIDHFLGACLGDSQHSGHASESMRELKPEIFMAALNDPAEKLGSEGTKDDINARVGSCSLLHQKQKVDKIVTVHQLV